jgi:hypothetical protein
MLDRSIDGHGFVHPRPYVADSRASGQDLSYGHSRNMTSRRIAVKEDRICRLLKSDGRKQLKQKKVSEERRCSIDWARRAE